MVQTNRLTKKDMFVIVSISLGKSADVRNAANNMHTLRASIIEYVCDADSPYIPSAMNRIATCHWKHKLNYTISQTDPMADDRVPYDDMSITTISVDPENCVDVDDAISIKRLPNNTLQIGIHIADPTSYIIEGSDLDAEALRRSESVYLNQTHHMFQESLTTQVFSLKQNQLCRR